MEAPLVLFTPMTHATQMVIAIFVGIGFGFALERAGFGRADNLVSVFYGRDFRVLRVMFSAIVTAMLGVYFLDLLGVMALGNLGLIPTYVLPQLVGGLLLGAGFIIGGYCPGTSLVAAASGKIDAIVFLVGIFLGSTVFTMGYGWLASFHQSTSMGRVLLGEYFGLPSGVLVLAVVAMAVGAFYGAGRAEAWVRRRLAASEEGAQ